MADDQKDPPPPPPPEKDPPPEGSDPGTDPAKDVTDSAVGYAEETTDADISQNPEAVLNTDTPVDQQAVGYDDAGAGASVSDVNDGAVDTGYSNGDEEPGGATGPVVVGNVPISRTIAPEGVGSGLKGDSELRRLRDAVEEQRDPADFTGLLDPGGLGNPPDPDDGGLPPEVGAIPPDRGGPFDDDLGAF